MSLTMNEFITSVIPMYEIPVVPERASLLDGIKDYARHKMGPSKTGWSKSILSRACELDDQTMIANQFINPNNDILKGICGDSKYLSWWSLPDRRPHLIGVCATLVEMILRVSRLKSDNFNICTTNQRPQKV